LRVETARISESTDYTSLVVLRLASGSGQESMVSGTLVGPRMQARIVDAFGFTVDIVPQKHTLFIRNEDQPGMIGKVGSILGEHGINIGNMAVGRNAPGSPAAMAITIDEPAPEEVLKALREASGFTDARSVSL
jgi:D-3-phosphoglycerate dehydrogenase / 2-oxoglutarate reductase